MASAAVPPAPTLDIADLTAQRVRAPAEFLVTAPDTTLDELPLDGFRPLTGRDVNQGISDRAFWIRMRLHNSGNAPVHWVLSHETTYLDLMTVYWVDNGGQWHECSLTDRAPFDKRMLDYRRLAFKHATPPGGSTTLYLRLAYEKPDSVSLNLDLAEAGRFADQSRREYALYGLYYGAMLVLVFISLAGAGLLRQWLFFQYAVFLVASALMWALLNGFAFQFLWPQSVFWHNEGFHILYLLMAASAFQFSRGFLRTRQRFPGIDRAIRCVQAIMMLGILMRFAGFYEPVLVLSFVGLLSLILLAPLGFWAYRQGQHYARWYAIAWVLYGIGLALGVISAGTPWLHWGMDSLVFAQAAGVLEALLLLVALGERLISWDRDRRMALRMAHQDPLTGLNNRRGMSLVYETFRQRFERTGLPVFLILIDLDHFKQINDTYGHEAGDQVLVDLADLLNRTSRPADVCIRYGGEEFVLLLQVPSEAVALDIAERIRLDFAGTPTEHEGRAIRHTLTAGIAPVFAADVQLSPSQMLRDADRALYQAKRQGRNRCRLYQGPSRHTS
ncbi:GGDEF domain-containing protein [Marinobacter halodurans]|uniref:diguanylate cyclase n=2 Tax=Marinobacter halodurans TaxID=2528979 RepID=A0ABY1ZNV8_9GAMM|nr:GGDEF domain-containing protein [Marinobacter halodurans]